MSSTMALTSDADDTASPAHWVNLFQAILSLSRAPNPFAERGNIGPERRVARLVRKDRPWAGTCHARAGCRFRRVPSPNGSQASLRTTPYFAPRRPTGLRPMSPEVQGASAARRQKARLPGRALPYIPD